MTTSGVFVLVKATTAAARPLVAGLFKRMRPDTCHAALLIAAQDLAARIETEEGYLHDQMHTAAGDPMPLRITARPPAGAPHPAMSTVADLLHAAEHGRVPTRLVITGEAGAGKSMLSVALLLAMIRYRTSLPEGNRAHVPVPVRVQAHGWDGDTDQAFTQWLAREITDRYRIHPRVATALITSTLIVPIIDAVDEMDTAAPDRAGAVLSHLNRPPWSRLPVVVVCRSGTLAHLRANANHPGLRRATTVTVQPLTASDVIDSLDHYHDHEVLTGDNFTVLSETIINTPDGTLAQVLSTPLMLTLAITALARPTGGPTARDLAMLDDHREIRDRLYDSRICAAIAATPSLPGRSAYQEAQVKQWAAALAAYLDKRKRQGYPSTGLSPDQVWKLAGWGPTFAVHTVVAVVIYAVTMAAAALIAGAQPALTMTSVALVFAVSVVTSYLGDTPFQAHPMHQRIPGLRGIGERFAWRVPGHARWKRGARAGAMTAGLLGAFMAIVSIAAWAAIGGAARQLVPLAVFVIVSVCSIGGVVGCIDGLSTTPHERTTLGSGHRRFFADDLIFASVAAAITMVAIAVSSTAGVLILGTHSSPAVWLPKLAADALVFGVTAWFLTSVTWTRHVSAALLFKLTGTFTARPMQFLEWATRAHLLRLHSTIYQFDHATYQQWLLPTAHNPRPEH